MAVKRYDGSAWQVVAGKGDQGTSSSISTWVKTASGGETSLSGNDDNSQALSYTVGQELVFINGTLLKRGSDYTATDGTTITGLAALAANDVATVWTVTAFSVTGAIANTIVDAKGDLITASGADVPARLAVGADGTVLTADSAQTLGVKWAAVSAAGKTLLSTTTLSGASTDITGISTAYTDLEVVVYGINPSTDLQVRIYPNDSAGISSQVGTRRYASGPTKDIESYASTYLVMANGQAYASGNTTNGAILVIYDYANTSAPVKPFHLSNRLQTNADGGTLGVMHLGGGINTSNAITQLKFYTSSGTFNGGTVKIYGVK